jgi:hypothetical protein
MPTPWPVAGDVLCRLRPALIALALWAAAAPSRASVWQASGALVDVTIEMDGGSAPLFAARDGSGRFYFEARAGRAYAVRIANRSPERVGVVLAVDGLNAVSGEREPGPSASARPGRMYVIDPWGDVSVRGWRTSLSDVRRFTFVDERASYAARTGRANARMGWIEAWVYRERSPVHVWRPRPAPWERPSAPYEEKDEARDRAEGAPEAAAPRATPAPAPAPEDAQADAKAADGHLQKKRGEGAGSYPGTGWGSRADDPAMLVDFVPDLRPADCVTLRYEYAPALRALGLLPEPWDRDRLRQRDQGEGFARPPAW